MATKKAKLFKYIFILVIFSIAVILILKVGNLYNSPAVGVIENNSIDDKSTISLDWTTVRVANNLVSFSYPEFMQPVRSNLFSYPIIDQFTFDYKDNTRWYLGISILDIPMGSLEDNNAYLLRSKNPQEYKLSIINIHGQEIYIMKDNKYVGFNKVGFLVNGKYQAIISLYGNDPTEITNLNKVFVSVLSSFKWVI